MPWTTPTLRQLRETVRDDITGALPGAVVTGNKVLRVMADAKAGLAHLVLRYIDWLARQFLPDTAESEWLDRHGNIWLVNADGSVGRKVATFSSGSVNFTGIEGAVVPLGTRLTGPTGIRYETTQEIFLGPAATPATVEAIDGGAAGNLAEGIPVSLYAAVTNVDGSALVATGGLTGGADIESDEDLRLRILQRIRNPPMGGDAEDYVLWTLSVAGVTRAWSYPLEMGMGTVTVRFMMDDLRAPTGFPLAGDVAAVAAYLDTVRPVAVKDFFVEAPIPHDVDVSIDNLVPDSTAIRAGITVSLEAMLLERAKPGQTIFAAWKSDAILSAPGVISFRLADDTDDVMPSAGHMATLGDVTYV